MNPDAPGMRLLASVPPNRRESNEDLSDSPPPPRSNLRRNSYRNDSGLRSRDRKPNTRKQHGTIVLSGNDIRPQFSHQSPSNASPGILVTIFRYLWLSIRTLLVLFLKQSYSIIGKVASWVLLFIIAAVMLRLVIDKIPKLPSLPKVEDVLASLKSGSYWITCTTLSVGCEKTLKDHGLLLNVTYSATSELQQASGMIGSFGALSKTSNELLTNSVHILLESC